MSQVRVRVFRNFSKEEIIEEMHKHSFRLFTALRVTDSERILKGSAVKLPSSNAGKVVARRRRVFLFWKTQCLIEQQTEIGYFYTWYNSSQLRFTDE